MYIYIVMVSPSWNDLELSRSRIDPHSVSLGIQGSKTDPFSLGTIPRPVGLGRSRVSPRLILDQCSPLGASFPHMVA